MWGESADPCPAKPFRANLDPHREVAIIIIAVALSGAAYAPVAQLDRALPSGGRGHRFESCRAYWSKASPRKALYPCGAPVVRSPKVLQ